MRQSRFIATIITVFTMIFSSITVCAAPKTMPDGNIFDAEYYAANNADVTAAFGRGESALYNHYINYGKKEGRAAYDMNVTGQKIAVSTAVNSTNLAENLASAFMINDYKTIQNYASKILSYSMEIDPFKTVDKGLSGTSMYNFSTSYGPLMITYYSGDDYKCIVNIALALQGSGNGPRITNETIDYQKRNEAIHAAHGAPICSSYVYGKNTFVIGDKWVSYVDCKNGYSYMEINTDGISYPSMKWYPDKADPNIFGQARIMHYCTH